MIKNGSWRNDPATDKQKKLIEEMNDFSIFPLPYIDLRTATKGECADYISANLATSHESMNTYIHEDAGDRI